MYIAKSRLCPLLRLSVFIPLLALLRTASISNPPHTLEVFDHGTQHRWEDCSDYSTYEFLCSFQCAVIIL